MIQTRHKKFMEELTYIYIYTHIAPRSLLLKCDCSLSAFAYHIFHSEFVSVAMMAFIAPDPWTVNLQNGLVTQPDQIQAQSLCTALGGF